MFKTETVKRPADRIDDVELELVTAMQIKIIVKQFTFCIYLKTTTIKTWQKIFFKFKTKLTHKQVLSKVLMKRWLKSLHCARLQGDRHWLNPTAT